MYFPTLYSTINTSAFLNVLGVNMRSAQQVVNSENSDYQCAVDTIKNDVSQLLNIDNMAFIDPLSELTKYKT